MTEQDYAVVIRERPKQAAAEWRTYEVGALISEQALAIGDGYRAKNSELSRCGLPFARAGNIRNGFQFSGVDYYPAVELHRVGEKISRPGDTVFTSKGTVGRIAFVKDDTPRFVYSPQLSYWRPLNINILEPRFLHYWMASREFSSQVKSVAGQTDMAEYVSLSDQRRMRITIPPLEEQRAIAHVLGTLDDKIELNRRMNETLEGMARALFKSWFVDFEPVRAKMEGRWRRGESLPGMPAELYDLFPGRLVGSEVGEVPEGWGVKALDGIATFLNGLALQKYPPTSDSALPVIKIVQLRAGHTLGSDSAGAYIPPQYVVHDGDMLFSWSGSLELTVWAGGDGALNQHLFKVSSDSYPQWLYYHWVREHLPEFRQIAVDKTTTMGHIQRRHLREALTVVPDSALLDSMSCHMQLLLDRSLTLRSESRALAAQRDALLPKLVSGKVRVSGGTT